MALPDQTLELTNSNQMPPALDLTGSELIPAATDIVTKLPMSFTPVQMGGYVLGPYTYNLTNFLDTVGNSITQLTEVLMVDSGQTYKITIGDLSQFVSPNITITGTGLAYVTDIDAHTKNVDVPKATIEECDAAIRDDVAVTPAGLAHYKARLDALEYKAMTINSFYANPNVVEIGSTITSVALAWSLNKIPVTLTMSNYSGPALLTTDTTATVTGSFTSNQSWTLTVDDGTSNTGHQTSSSASLLFENKRYWGVSPSTTLDNTGILALSSEFSTSRIKDLIYDATGGNYVYYAYPTSFGDLAATKVGGLAFSDYTTTVVSFTNASGYTTNYNLIRINNIQTGSNIQVHWE